MKLIEYNGLSAKEQPKQKERNEREKKVTDHYDKRTKNVYFFCGID